jgi:heme O synthase-like polyprenyltransferase
MCLAIATIVSYVFLYTPSKACNDTYRFLLVLFPALCLLWVAIQLSPAALTEQLSFSSVYYFFGSYRTFLALSWMYKHDYQRGGFKMTAVRDANGTSVATQMILYCLMLCTYSAIAHE